MVLGELDIAPSRNLKENAVIINRWVVLSVKEYLTNLATGGLIMDSKYDR